eukprot:CAMPEP_0115850138 /NCGR_PEP_ID=MMETSP0287-20121206/11809_1 /TAXON_ID=412157 /ORGANISM="Chrysochromulina rotalis, Strain UIO044" /LENGTH=139 /DNA_ID=CAMNT_0003304125 /DNA_START=20 /DNA_END=439 /DNA_ORIENTATION=+
MADRVSQINGGGCLAPPTPSVGGTKVLAESLEEWDRVQGKEPQSNFDIYSKQLPPSLAWRTSSGITNVIGMGAYINPKEMTVPLDPVKDMGMIMRGGRRVFVNRLRNDGETVVWETTQERSSRPIREHVYGKPEVQSYN